MKRTIFFILLLTFQILNQFSYSQTKSNYFDDVQTIKAYDQMYGVPAHPILFVGSSSIRKWDDLQIVFGKYNVLNRGVGGTVINDINYYLDDIVFPYQPRQIVLYVGDNDVPDAKVTPDSILQRTIRLYGHLRTKLPNVPLVYIAIKPSPSREKYIPKAQQANELIKQYMSKQKHVVFVDVFSLMMKNGKVRKELFGPDMLHMNPEGYKLWEKAVSPYLIK
jgi:lysophospholipase L1-like esterase